MHLYIQENIFDHPRTLALRKHFSHAKIITVKHYKNIFDKTFPLPPKEKIWIVADAPKHAVSLAPTWYGHSSQWFFVKTVLNCLFDCKYCYLKGAFKNDFPVIFVDYETIWSQVEEHIISRDKTETMRWYLSDRSDTQWFDRLLWLHEFFLPRFEQYPQTMVETRTKGADIQTLLDMPATNNVEIAYSLNPQSLIDAYETGTASLDRRIANIQALLDHGYKVWARFMPLLPVPDYYTIYKKFLTDLSLRLDLDRLFSSFAWGLLFTKQDYKGMLRKEPDLDVLYRLSDDDGTFIREEKKVRETFYQLFQQYVSDCHICLDQEKDEEATTPKKHYPKTS